MLKFLLEKEFKQALRNKATRQMLFVMPFMMILVMPWAATQEIKDVNLSIVNNDHSVYSNRLVEKLSATEYFRITDISSTGDIALKSIESNKADIILEIEPEFEKNLIKYGQAKVLISANSVNGTKGLIGSTYLGSIINDFAGEIRNETYPPVKGSPKVPIIHVTSLNRFNPSLDYKNFMVPALMVMLLTTLTGFLPALNIVTEKEFGSIEQMNVTPVNRFSFILAKLIPFWVIGFVMLSICITIAALVYNLVPLGSLLTIYGFTMLYILVISGLGLVVSNFSDTMQQATFLIFFFMMFFNLMSGLYTPVDSMPQWAQDITIINPLKYFMQVMRSIYLKGSSFIDLLPQFGALCIMAMVSNTWAVISYRKRN